MSKVTRKLRVTGPKALAERYRIRPGEEIRFEEADENTRVVPAAAALSRECLDVDARLRLFDGATARQRERESDRPRRRSNARAWTREALYEHGRSRANRQE